MTTTDLAQIQLRRGTASEWSTANPTLVVGELAYESDTKLIKVGDGSTAYNSLGYMPEQLAKQIYAATSKTTPVDADVLPLSDSAASNVLKKLTWANLKATLKTYFDTLYTTTAAVAATLASYATTASLSVYATLTGAETLTNKTLTSPVVTGLTLNDASIVFEGATADAYETTLTVTDPTADRTITFKDASGTVAFTSDIVPAALVGCTALAEGTTQSLTSGVGNVIALSTELFDTDSFHDNSTNNSRLTIPTGKTGKYLVTVNFSPLNTPGYAIISLLKNGSTLASATYGVYEGKVQRGASNISGGQTILTLAAGDYIEFSYQSDLATGNQTIYAQFSAIYLGA